MPELVRDKKAVLSMRPGKLLTYLSDKGFSGIYIDGGKVKIDLLKVKLVNELIITKAPVLIGSGIPLFNHLDRDIQFKHLRTEVQANGLVRSYY